MKDIFKGLLIIFICFIIVDFLYTEKNTCSVENDFGTENYKCGILKKQSGIEIYLFNRYW